MSGSANDYPPSGRHRSFSLEIALALLIKLVLLSGLWFLFFQANPDESTAEPGIEALFAASQRAAASTYP